MLKPDPDDVRQEVELQRLLGRRVSKRIVRRRIEADEARRAEAERSAAGRDTGETPVDFSTLSPVEYPLLVDKFVRRLSVSELMRVHNCRTRRTLARKVRAEAERLFGGKTNARTDRPVRPTGS